MELNVNEPAKKSKSLALTSVGKSVKSTQVWEPEESASAGDSEEGPDDEHRPFIIKIFKYLSNKKKILRNKYWLHRIKFKRQER